MKQSPKITLSMIVKNEEKYLHECLESVKGVVDEIVIVDTGSNDNTIKIAKEFGAAIYNFNWTNDFSKARNYALSKSTGDWILYMDADERLSPNSVDELKNITRRDSLTGCVCIVNNLDDYNGKQNYMRYTRLFRNSTFIKFSGAVHEQIDDSLMENGYELIDTNIEIIHVGYNIPDEEIKLKARRNLSILNKEYSKTKSAYTAFQLANTYSILKDFENANKYFSKAVENGNLKNEYKAHAYLNLSDFELQRHNLVMALEYLNKGLQNNVENPLLNLLASDIYFRLNKKNVALGFCREAFNGNKKILSGEDKSKLTIVLKPEVIISKGIYYSFLAENKNKLSFYLNELEKVNKKLFSIFIKLIENSYFPESNETQLKNIISEDNIDAFLVIIESYKDKGQALEIAEKIKEKFIANSKFLKTLGLLYSENNLLNEAVDVFEKSLTMGKKDPSSVFFLISILIQNNQLERIPDLLLFAEKEFGNIPEFNSRFEILKQKLGAIFNNNEIKNG